LNSFQLAWLVNTYTKFNESVVQNFTPDSWASLKSINNPHTVPLYFQFFYNLTGAEYQISNWSAASKSYW